MLDILKIKEGSQARESINEAVVQSYAEHLTAGGTFPPIVVFFDSKNYWLADGWHRLVAHRRVGSLEISEEVHVGNQRDALRFALGANATHGLARTNADKRNAVITALEDGEWSLLSNKGIAELCKVSNTFVADVKKSQQGGKRLPPPTQHAEITSKKIHLPAEGNIPASPKPEESKNSDPENHELEQLHDSLSALAEENDKLRAHVSANTLPEDEREEYLDHLNSIVAENNQLSIANKALKDSLNSAMTEIVELKRQCASQRKQIEKLKC